MAEGSGSKLPFLSRFGRSSDNGPSKSKSSAGATAGLSSSVGRSGTEDVLDIQRGREPIFRQTNAPLVVETAESSLVNVINREGIAARLPHTTGTLSSESEARLNQAAIALRQFPLSAVLVPLLNQLETLTRAPYSNPDDYVAVDLLQSQLFLLRTIADCTTQHWANVATSSTTFLDPVPLDDQVANRLLLVSLLFLSLPTEDAAQGIYSRSPSIAVISQTALKAATKPNKGISTPPPSPSTRQSVSQEIGRQAGRIAYFLSASNWPIVFGRIKYRINQYANEDSSDLIEMRLLEWCCLDRRRLSVVIQELCQTYIHLRKGAQASISVVLRRAIWSWIESFSGEFEDMIVSGRRIEGGAEVLFDVIYTLSESSDKRKVFAWPVLTMLLCLLPDSLEKLVIGESGRASGMIKKFQFFESLRKSLKGTKLAEIALACYIDLCRAAAITKPGLESSLRLLVSDIDSDLKAKLLDPARPFSNAEGLPDVDLMRDAHVALFHLDSTAGSRIIVMALASSGSTDVAKLAAVAACLILGEDTDTSTESLAGLATPIRNVLIEYSSQSREVDQQLGHGRRGSSRTSIRALSTDAHSTRAELLRSILKLWSARPELCISSPTSTDAGSDVNAASSSQVFDSLSSLLVDSNLQGSACKVLLELCRFERSLGATSFGPTLSKAIRNYLADSAREQVGELDVLELFLCDVHSQLELPEPAWTTLETSLLLSMCSPDAAVRARARECFEMIARLSSDARKDDSNKDNSVLVAISASSRAFHGTPVDNWRAISEVCGASYGLLAAFDEALRRWKALLLVLSMRSDGDSKASSIIARRRDVEPRTPESQLSEFANLTAFLASTAGACHQVEGRARTVERLVQELVDLLVSENPAVQSAVKDALGLGLGLDALPILFKQLHSIISRFIESDDTSPSVETSSIFSHFIGEALSLLSSQLDHLSGDLPNASASLLDDLLLASARFVSHMGRSATATRLKVEIMRITESVLSRRIGRRDRDDLVFRNHLLEHVVNWYGQSKSGATSDNLVEQGAISALVPILDELVVINVANWIPTKLPTPSTQLFNRYYDFVQTLLRSSPDSPPRSRNLAITAFANLLGANVESSRRRLAEMTLHPDFPLRAAFLEALALVLAKGIRLDESAPVVPQDTSSRLEELLRSSDLTLALAMSEVATASSYEDLSDCFLKVLGKRRSIKLIKALLELEISATENESSLLRANSFSTRMLTVFSRACGYGYLRATLHELIQSLCDSPEFSLEFDPHRVADDSSEGAAVIRRLEKIAEAFLVTIENSVDQVPKPIREICSHIGVVVGDVFETSVYTAIGGYMFLRFISPAIVSPDITLDLELPADNRDVRRGLVLITKVLQALANNVRFGIKEPGLRALNDFCDTQIFGMTRFLQAVSHYDPADDLELEYDGIDLDESERGVIHQFLLDHKEKIKAALSLPADQTTRHWHDAGESFSTTLGNKTLEQLDVILSSHVSIEPEVADSESYSEFMRSNGARPLDFELWNSVFYESKDQENNTVTFCLSLAKIDAETADIESLIYFALSRIANSAGSMNLLVDVTGFEARNQVPAQWLLRIAALLSPTTLQSFQNIIIFNPSTTFKAYARTILRRVSFDNFESRRIIAVSGTAELNRHLSSSLLSSSSLNISREKRTVFRNVTQLSEWKVEYPVQIEVGTATILVTTAKKHQILSDVDGIIYDVLRLSDIVDVTRISVGLEGQGIGIVYAGEASPRRFLVQNRRDELFQLLSVAIGTAQMSLPPPTRPPSRSGPTLPHLFSSVVFNLCSTDPQVRQHAYSLLSALPSSVSLDAKDEHYQCSGIHIPASDVALVTSVSERFASTSPEHSLEFVHQFTTNASLASTSELSAYTHALRPHLHNLYSLVHTERTKAVAVNLVLQLFIRRLLVLALREPVAHAILQSRIWPAIAKIDFLVPVVLSETIRVAMHPEATKNASAGVVPSQILLSLGGGSLLRGKLLARLRQAIARTALSPRSTIELSVEWTEISTLLQLDASLSFHAGSPALHLPEVFHIYSVISATAPLPARIAARQILVNTVHACFSDARNLSKLRASLASLPTPELAPTSFESLVAGLLLILADAAPSLDQANAWRARWSSLVASTCFQRSPLQSSSFIVLAALAVDMDNGDYSYQLLTLLSSSIRLNSPDSCTLSISIIDCLAKTIVGLVSDRSFFEGLFWSAVAILQVGQARISMSTIRLLTAVVKALESLNDGGDLEEELLQFRKMETDSSPKLDESSGVSFNHFPFAITRLCQSVPLDDSVEELLYALARWSRSTAFFLTLLPSATKNGKLDRLLETVGIVPQASSEVIVESFLRKARGDKESIILTTALLTRSVSTVGEDEGLLLLYEPLSALLSEYPDVAAKFRLPLLSVVHAALSSQTTSSSLFAAAAQLSSQIQRAPNDSSDISTILSRLGFPGLLSTLAPSSPDLEVTPSMQMRGGIVSKLITHQLQ